MRCWSALFLPLLCFYGSHFLGSTALLGQVTGPDLDEARTPSPSPPLQFAPQVPTSPPSRTQSPVPSPDQSGQDIRDIRNPLTIPNPWLPFAIAAGITAGLLLLGFLIYRWFRRRKDEPGDPPLSPYDQALQDLRATRSLIDSAQDKEFSSAVSDVVRYFLERQFDMPAPESTTEEFLYRIRDHSFIKGKLADAFSEFLVLCDLAKFARHSHGRIGMQELYRKAESLIEETYLKHRMQLSVLGPTEEPKPEAEKAEVAQ